MARWRQARGPRDAPAAVPVRCGACGYVHRLDPCPDPVVFGVLYKPSGTGGVYPPIHGCGAGSFEPGPCWCCERPWAAVVT